MAATAVASILDVLKKRGGLKSMDVANMATVSPATVSRWTQGKASPHPKTQFAHLRSSLCRRDRLAEFYTLRGNPAVALWRNIAC